MSIVPSSFEALSTDHKDQIIKIRTCFQNWLLAISDVEKKVAGARERFAVATKDLEGE